MGWAGLRLQVQVDGRFFTLFRVPQKTSTHFCSILVGVCMCVYVGITERTNERTNECMAD